MGSRQSWHFGLRSTPRGKQKKIAESQAGCIMLIMYDHVAYTSRALCSRQIVGPPSPQLFLGTADAPPFETLGSCGHVVISFTASPVFAGAWRLLHGEAPSLTAPEQSSSIKCWVCLPTVLPQPAFVPVEGRVQHMINYAMIISLTRSQSAAASQARSFSQGSCIVNYIYIYIHDAFLPGDSGIPVQIQDKCRNVSLMNLQENIWFNIWILYVHEHL